jgi:hypothetical protein
VPRKEDETNANEAIFDILQWKDLLSSDSDVSEFERPNLESWTSDCDHLLDGLSSSPCRDLREHANSLVDRAKQLHLSAGEKASKFNTRNELLNDIIASLKEIGFLVTDPRFDNPQDPGGTVVLVAMRGNERMEAKIDLSNQIKSTWNEISEEHCKSSFFQYVDAMSARSVEVKPDRDDLQARPERIQVNAKSLPRNQTDNA